MLLATGLDPTDFSPSLPPSYSSRPKLKGRSIPMEEDDDLSTTQQPENVKFRVGLVEDDSSDSSCMIVLKLPSGQNHVPASSADTTMSPRTPESHKQVVYDDGSQTSKSCKGKREKLDSESYTLAMERAKELRTTLPSEHPSFIKQMQTSHVGHRCRMSVPFEFRRSHLPTHNVEIILEDESGESYKVKYILGRGGEFIGGLRKYSVEHNLVEGDVLVFHLFKPCFFKVYIIRANDAALAETMKLACSNVQGKEGKKKRKCESAYIKPSPGFTRHLDTDQGSVKKNSLISNPSFEACTLSGNDSDFENFKIIVNGEIVDPELPRSIRFKYYKLCCSQKSYLNEHLLKNVNSRLASEIIKGTVDVADAIKTCKISTSKDDFSTWDNTLEGFKALGMEVGFLRDRLKELVNLESKFRDSEKLERCLQVKKMRDSNRQEIRRMEQKILELKRTTEKLEDEMKTMKPDILECKHSFEEKASAPW